MNFTEFRELLQYLSGKEPETIPIVSYSDWWANLDQLQSDLY